MQSSNRANSKMAMSEINVTPFVDVMLVLLVIFMVTAPLMQQGLEVNLPKTSSAGVAPSEDPFILSIDASGKIKISNVEVNSADLKTKVSALFQLRTNKQVYIQADQSVDYGVVAIVMAELKAAGITNIGLLTLPKD
jgi:biopolymer transport protein TolR